MRNNKINELENCLLKSKIDKIKLLKLEESNPNNLKIKIAGLEEKKALFIESKIQTQQNSLFIPNKESLIEKSKNSIKNNKLFGKKYDKFLKEPLKIFSVKVENQNNSDFIEQRKTMMNKKYKLTQKKIYI